MRKYLKNMIPKRNKRNKYGNTKIVSENGDKWDSKREMKRWLVLKDAEQSGLITDLRRQVRFELIPAIKRTEIVQLKTKTKEVEKTEQQAITYTADFVYTKDGKTVVEDIKPSPNTVPKEFMLKAKLFFWKYGFKIRLVYKASEEV